MQHSLVQDVQTCLDDAERAVEAVKEGYVCDLESNLDTILEHISSAEGELRYVNDELEEKQDIYDEIESRFSSPDPDDWEFSNESEMDELRELRDKVELLEADTELENLRTCHENQREVIMALLTRLSEINAAVSRDEINKLLGTLAKDRQLPTPDNTPPVGSVPNCS
jgi:hypothetical protein